MKLAHSLAFLVTAALTVPFALADFHVILEKPDWFLNTNNLLIGCPSNHFDCHCLQKGDRRVTMVGVPESTDKRPDQFFYTKGKLCGWAG
ncbi:hypothetical protein BS47DRAFT_208088 [Hydnum rufescens UP504]|uniref:Secreted protein n=1 Tax=Hydnum rufescens UP504 TaxID=1448309 RepID=A0A9P6DN94_9AGAM|nr:hypothetical protein BS47DRAFT_208088 [Hydnum rufescens UP504]